MVPTAFRSDVLSRKHHSVPNKTGIFPVSFKRTRHVPRYVFPMALANLIAHPRQKYMMPVHAANQVIVQAMSGGSVRSIAVGDPPSFL